MADKKKACKNCGLLVNLDVNSCPNCDSNQFVEKYKGRVVILDVPSSFVAEKANIKKPGIYALKY